VVKFNMQIHNKSKYKELRKNLRKNLTPAETKLWKQLKNSQLAGRKFRRQHSIGDFVVDFYCPREKLIIELIGNVHLNPVNEEYDFKRNNYLRSLGFEVLRIENEEVFKKTEVVLETIKSKFKN
jgi:very-short-patch-repair endonuclease